MGASRIVQHVYRDTIEHFGEPDHSVVFDEPPPPAGSGWPMLIDVFQWNPTTELDMYSFSTLGMSDGDQLGKGIRTELHFAVRGSGVETTALQGVPKFLANLALFPFIHSTCFDFYHSVRKPGPIPCFDQCVGLVFLPAFVRNGWDTVSFEGQEIRLLNVVPIAKAEYEYRDQNGTRSLYDYWAKHGIDIFSNRE